MIKQKILFFLYGITVLALFLYSFTQIDLSLTFSRIDILRNIVGSFQYVGYFQRPISTAIYIAILIALFGFYFYFLKQAVKKKIDKKFIWKIIVMTVVLLVASYNAFSYDIFNYVFDAKIFTHYSMNPYEHKALDFAGDPMLSFMRWTHRTYPYGPFWLVLTIPLSYVGLNFFLPTFFLFKLMIASSFVGSLYFIGKILKKISPEKEILGLIFFGLNPLIIIESLVSGHLDMVMMFFALWAFYQLINKKYFYALVLLALSVGVKFATVFLLPIFIAVLVLQRKKKLINWSLIFMISAFIMSIAAYLSSIYSGNFQPWYLILPLTFAAFISIRYYILIPSIIFSFLGLLNYAPYLYLGNWDKPVPSILLGLQQSSIVISFLVVLVYFLKLKTAIKK